MILSRRRFLVRAGLVAAAAPFIVRPESLMKIVMPKLELPLPRGIIQRFPSQQVMLIEGLDQFGKLVQEIVPYSDLLNGVVRYREIDKIVVMDRGELRISGYVRSVVRVGEKTTLIED